MSKEEQTINEQQIKVEVLQAIILWARKRWDYLTKFNLADGPPLPPTNRKALPLDEIAKAVQSDQINLMPYGDWLMQPVSA